MSVNPFAIDPHHPGNVCDSNYRLTTRIKKLSLIKKRSHILSTQHHQQELAYDKGPNATKSQSVHSHTVTSPKHIDNSSSIITPNS